MRRGSQDREAPRGLGAGASARRAPPARPRCPTAQTPMRAPRADIAAIRSGRSWVRFACSLWRGARSITAMASRSLWRLHWLAYKSRVCDEVHHGSTGIGECERAARSDASNASVAPERDERDERQRVERRAWRAESCPVGGVAARATPGASEQLCEDARRLTASNYCASKGSPRTARDCLGAARQLRLALGTSSIPRPCATVKRIFEQFAPWRAGMRELLPARALRAM